jgi:hypothetical protein
MNIITLLGGGDVYVHKTVENLDESCPSPRQLSLEAV